MSVVFTSGLDVSLPFYGTPEKSEKCNFNVMNVYLPEECTRHCTEQISFGLSIEILVADHMLSHILQTIPLLRPSEDEIDDDDGWCGPVSPDQPGDVLHPSIYHIRERSDS